jgi:hypothetical protein
LDCGENDGTRSVPATLLPKAADDVVEVAMDFGGGGDDEALEGAVVEDGAGAADYVPEGGVDGAFDEIDEIGAPVRCSGRAAKGEEGSGAGLDFAGERKSGGEGVGRGDV